MVPEDHFIKIQLLDEKGNMVSETVAILQGEVGQAGTFSGQLRVDNFEGEAILYVFHEVVGGGYTARVTVSAP